MYTRTRSVKGSCYTVGHLTARNASLYTGSGNYSSTYVGFFAICGNTYVVDASFFYISRLLCRNVTEP